MCHYQVANVLAVKINTIKQKHLWLWKSVNGTLVSVQQTNIFVMFIFIAETTLSKEL